MAHYCRRCVPNFAKVAAHLVKLAKKHARLVWEHKQLEAFEVLKALLVPSKVMAHQDACNPYKQYTDACDYTVGAILALADD